LGVTPLSRRTAIGQKLCKFNHFDNIVTILTIFIFNEWLKDDGFAVTLNLRNFALSEQNFLTDKIFLDCEVCNPINQISMKNLIFLSVLLVLISGAGCNSTSKSGGADSVPGSEAKEPLKQQADFNGIFEFRIDSSTPKILDGTGYKYTEVTVSDVKKKLKIHPDLFTTELDVLCEGVRIFYLEDFTKSGVHFTVANLTFYHDTLIKFSAIVSDGLMNILMSKYPQFTQNKEDKNNLLTWHNNLIIATLNDFGKDGQDFTIQDETKYNLATKSLGTKEAEYLKEVNKNL
jgi:hypothetical protein